MINFNILDTPIIHEDTVPTVITSTPKKKVKIKNPITQFVNKYYKLNIEEYKEKMVELNLDPAVYAELVKKYHTKTKRMAESLEKRLKEKQKSSKEKKMLHSKLSQIVSEKETLELLTKFNYKQKIMVKSHLDYKMYKFIFEFKPYLK